MARWLCASGQGRHVTYKFLAGLTLLMHITNGTTCEGRLGLVLREPWTVRMWAFTDNRVALLHVREAVPYR